MALLALHLPDDGLRGVLQSDPGQSPKLLAVSPAVALTAGFEKAMEHLRPIQDCLEGSPVEVTGANRRQCLPVVDLL